MARFFGRFEHSLDTKGRVILPARFRGPFEHGGYVSMHEEGCLALWTPDEFDRQMEEMLRRAETSRSERNVARLRSSGSYEVDIDRQGRLMIPVRLREYAGLEADVLVVGAIDRVELWQPEAWAERVAPEQRRLVGGGEEGAQEVMASR